MFRSDRIGHGGGVAIYIKNSIKGRIKCFNNVSESVEYLFIEVACNCNKILLGCVYRPRNNIDMTAFFEQSENLFIQYDEIIITGDFNCNCLSDKSLVTLMGCCGLDPVNLTTPTHFTTSSSTLLDMFFVTNRLKVQLYDQIAVPQFSKHDLIFLSYDAKFDRTNTSFTYRNFKNINIVNLCQSIRDIP